MLDKKAINKAIDYIEQHLYEKINVADVAKSASYSYFHFHRFFYAFTGETLGNYIRGRRLTQGAYDLSHSSKSIIEISLSLDFETPESFTRAFKKRYLMTPSAYRKKKIDMLIGEKPRMSLKQRNLENKTIPEIVNLSPTVLVGKRYYTGKIKESYLDIWQTHVKNLPRESCRRNFYGVFETTQVCESNNFDLENSADLFIGVEYSKFPHPNLGYIVKNLSGGQYAKFIHKGPIKDIIETYQYIWGTWLAENKYYDLDSREDFELYTKKFKSNDDMESQVDIFIPITQKILK